MFVSRPVGTENDSIDLIFGLGKDIIRIKGRIYTPQHLAHSRTFNWTHLHPSRRAQSVTVSKGQGHGLSSVRGLRRIILAIEGAPAHCVS